MKYKQTNNIPKKLKYSIWKKVKLFDLKGGKLYYENKEVIPIEDVNKVIDSEYNDCHYYGRDKLYHLIKSKYVGISRNDIMSYIANNQTNQLHSRPKLRNLTIKPIIVKRPRERLQIDFIEISKDDKHLNMGYRYVLTCIDCFSKYAFCYPTKSRKKGYFKYIRDLVEKYNFSVIQSDKEFDSTDMRNLCEEKSITHIISRPYKPSSNGAIESFNKFIKHQIFKYLTNSDSKIWINALPKIVENYNNSYHSTIKMTPNECWNGDKEIIKQTKKNITRQAKKMLKNIKQINKYDIFKIGDNVRILKIFKNFDKGYKQNYSDDIFKIEKINNLRSGVRSFVLDNGKTYYAHQLIKVDKDKLITPNQREVKDIYFNREKHLAKARQKRKSKNKTLDTDDFQIVLDEYDDNKGDDFHIYIEQD